MIVQTGMRTDIPAFYSKWFLNRIKEGYVLVRNPRLREGVHAVQCDRWEPHLQMQPFPDDRDYVHFYPASHNP